MGPSTSQRHIILKPAYFLDLEFVCDLGIEWLGLSFVQRAKDVKEAKKIVRGRAAILSKIETNI